MTYHFLGDFSLNICLIIIIFIFEYGRIDVKVHFEKEKNWYFPVLGVTGTQNGPPLAKKYWKIIFFKKKVLL